MSPIPASPCAAFHRREHYYLVTAVSSDDETWCSQIAHSCHSGCHPATLVFCFSNHWLQSASLPRPLLSSSSPLILILPPSSHCCCTLSQSRSNEILSCMLFLFMAEVMSVVTDVTASCTDNLSICGCCFQTMFCSFFPLHEAVPL